MSFCVLSLMQDTDGPIVATTDYGIDFASICGGRFGQGDVWGVQFHPEKSQAIGLRILRNFVELVRAGSRQATA